jgi:hypothetical protein
MAEAKKAHAVGFNHVALEVGDIEEALAFYGRLLDCGSTRTASNGIDHMGRGIFSPARTCIARRCARTRTEISSRLLGGPLLPRTWDRRTGDRSPGREHSLLCSPIEVWRWYRRPQSHG